MSGEIVGLRLPDDLYEVIAREAEASGNSMQSIIRSILAKHYGRIPTQAEHRDGEEAVNVQ